MRQYAFVLFLLAFTGSAYAEEPIGCDKFAWPLERERALLTGTEVAPIQNGSALDLPSARAAALKLVALPEAKLPMTPGRTPRFAASSAGFVRLTLPAAGTYQVTLSSGAWLDAVQDGRYIKPKAFSGARGCAGVRKSVRFDLAAGPFILQVSGLDVADIRFSVAAVAP